MPLIRAKFSLDSDLPDNPVYTGFHDPADHWNGWASPYFYRGEIDKIVANNSECLRWADEGLEYYSEGLEYHGLAFTQKIKPTVIGGKLLWPMQIGWTWAVEPKSHSEVFRQIIRMMETADAAGLYRRSNQIIGVYEKYCIKNGFNYKNPPQDHL